MRLLMERNKVDTAIVYQALATPAPGITSRYFKLDRWGKAMFAIVVDTLAAAETVVCEVWEALINTGVGGAAIGGAAPTATATITANIEVTVATLTFVTVAVGNTITINGVVFTAAAAPDHANQVFDQSGATDTLDAADFVTCLMHAASQALLVAAGGAITATSAAGVVTLTVTEAGEDVMTISRVGVPITIATVQAFALLEVEDTALSAADSWVAINLVGPASANAAVVLIRGDSRYEPVFKAVAAYDTDK